MAGSVEEVVYLRMEVADFRHAVGVPALRSDRHVVERGEVGAGIVFKARSRDPDHRLRCEYPRAFGKQGAGFGKDEMLETMLAVYTVDEAVRYRKPAGIVAANVETRQSSGVDVHEVLAVGLPAPETDVGTPPNGPIEKTVLPEQSACQ